MVRKKIVYISNHGSEHSTEFECRKEDASLNGFTFLCPACEGTGVQDGNPITESRLDRKATAWGGQFAHPVYSDVVVGYEKVECCICSGHGWTAKEKVAVTEEKVIGWQDKAVAQSLPPGLNK